MERSISAFDIQARRANALHGAGSVIVGKIACDADGSYDIAPSIHTIALLAAGTMPADAIPVRTRRGSVARPPSFFATKPNHQSARGFAHRDPKRRQRSILKVERSQMCSDRGAPD